MRRRPASHSVVVLVAPVYAAYFAARCLWMSRKDYAFRTGYEAAMTLDAVTVSLANMSREAMRILAEETKYPDGYNGMVTLKTVGGMQDETAGPVWEAGATGIEENE